MKKFTILKAVVAALIVPTLVAGSALAAPAGHDARDSRLKAKLTLVHGVPGADGFPVDISLYSFDAGIQQFKAVTFGTVAGPLKEAPGIYWVAVRAAGAPRFSSPLLSSWLYLAPGVNKSVVAHLAADGTPRLDVYRNDVSSTGGQSRVVVRHDAEAPAVDILAGGAPVISDLKNPRQATITVPDGTYPIAVAPAGSTTPVFGPVDLTFAPNTVTIVYAVGSLSGGSFTPLVQVLPTR